MRTENREVVYAHKVFIAVDGREFDSEKDCISHEAELNIEERLDEIETNHDAEDMIPCDGDFHGTDDTTYTWVRPANMRQIKTLKLAYPDIYVDKDDIDRWLCIEEDGENQYVARSSLDNSIHYIKRLFDKFGYNVIITDENGNEVK